MADNGISLDFTTSVLGADAAQRLKDKKVTQTIRSRKSAYPFFTKRGMWVPLKLDGKVLYNVRISIVEQKNLGELSQFDAEIGGFDNLDDLNRAAKRAGFRFKDLGDYEAYRIEFVPERN